MLRKGIYGECLNCYRYNTNYSWCQSCDPQLLTEGWTSGNGTIDKLIKSTQLEVTKYDNSYYLQWIPYNKLENIEKMDESHFATICKETSVPYVNLRNTSCKSYQNVILLLPKVILILINLLYSESLSFYTKLHSINIIILQLNK